MHALTNPIAFAEAWAQAWNSRAVEAVLAHFHEDAVFTSPLAMRIGYAVDGVVRGKPALRDYWTRALAINPKLHFRLTGAFVGVDTLVIAYDTQVGQSRLEVLIFRERLIGEGYGLFAV